MSGIFNANSLRSPGALIAQLHSDAERMAELDLLIALEGWRRAEIRRKRKPFVRVRIDSARRLLYLADGTQEVQPHSRAKGARR